ncbi:uncharacterized protein LOC122294862 isoform X3 [Carya illinoinensis]|nr:uncharacterized protein LOC122294862 isoform X3 [Carya illinoinensis]
MISEQDLAMKDNAGNTALHEAIISGNYRMVECLITKNRSLVSFRSALNELPVVSTMAMGHKELARYLYSLTPSEELEAEKAEQGAKLLTYAIHARDLDLALHLIKRCPSWAFAFHGEYFSPLQALTVVMTSSQFARINWLKRWIYNHSVHISSAGATDQIRLDINQNDQERSIGSGQALLRQRRQTVSSLLNLFGLKDLYEATLVDIEFQDLLSRIWKVIRSIRISDINMCSDIIADTIFSAISRGNFVFVSEMLEANTELYFIRNSSGMTIFHYAVLHRQHQIFNLIYGLKQKNDLLRYRDNDGNTILHTAGKLTEVTPIDHITGSVLQMQREIQWFKEVERICPPMSKELLNRDGLSARDLFTKTHRNLREKGEKWMKATTTSGSVVGTLIITIMFAAAFTIPGGNHQETGLPILAHDKLFKIFIIVDSVSFFSSSTAVLMFLGIFTSRYADEDFLISLPRKMIIGFFTLFLSIITMMIAFSTALLLTLRGESWIFVPIISLACVPILFVSMPFRLLVDMFVSTYGSGIFDRNMKLWF